MSEQIELASGNVKAAMEGVKSGDLWMAPRSSIRVHPDFNVRTENADHEAHIVEVGELILANGYDRSKPLTVFVALEDGVSVIYVVDGHYRLAGVDYANARGAKIENIPSVTTAKGTSMEDITVGLVTTNSGKPLTPLEKAIVCKRLVGYQMEVAEIARRLGMTKGYVDELLLLVGSSKKVRDMVADGGVSASLAVETIQKHGAEAAKVLTEKLTEAKATGKTKVTKAAMATKEKKRDLIVEGFDWIRQRSVPFSDTDMVDFLIFLTGKDAKVIRGLFEA